MEAIEIIGIVAGSLFLLWVLVNLKTSRPDGTLIKKVHPYRKIMQFIMPSRMESVVLFDLPVRVDPLLKFIEARRSTCPTTVNDCIVAALGDAMRTVPEMNRFVSGRRLYQRDKVLISFSMKRKKLSKKARISLVKLHIKEDMSLDDMIAAVHDKVGVERSGEKTHADKEYAFFNAIPRPVLNWGVKFLMWADYQNLLPRSFVEPDPCYSSAILANLGSLKMRAGYHHLFEWGNCHAFVMAGAIEERPIVVDGEIQVAKILPIRFTYDERIDDGLTARHGIDVIRRTLENPDMYLGNYRWTDRTEEQKSI